jgi:SAM-dependent methyltransferases related to tRNA (uracil-5-)-methyltransferase
MKKLFRSLLDNAVRILSERIYSFTTIFNLLPSKKVLTFRNIDTSIWNTIVTRFFIMVARFSINKKIIKKEVNFVVVDDSFKMSLNVNEYTQCNYYFSFPSESLIELIKLGGDTFIDIGANVGFFSLYASKRFKNVIAFEPTQASIDLLKNNFRDEMI